MSEEKESGNLIVNEKVEKSNLEQWYTDSGETDPELLERRRLVAICWNQKNMSVAATAKELGVHPNTIYRDRKWLLDRWQAAVQADVVEIVAKEVAKLDQQEADLWEAWESSKEAIVRTEEEQLYNDEGKKVGGKKVKKVTTGRLPDPKYMDMIIHCQERRAKLLGLDKAVEFKGASFSMAIFIENAYTSALKQREGGMKDITPPIDIEKPEPLDEEEVE